MINGRPSNPDRQNAIAFGLKTYNGSPHSKCGTTERYLGGGCVYCARTIAKEQRDARKFLKAQADHIASLTGEETVNPDPEENAAASEPLDMTEDDGLGIDNDEPSEAERFRQSIEDIL